MALLLIISSVSSTFEKKVNFITYFQWINYGDIQPHFLMTLFDIEIQKKNITAKENGEKIIKSL